ncbi:MAG: PorV/PorQ family protein [Elusimicrobia bacterium]|nr:PorV/PorQ family protein [Elusimicrobiota bacterium]
MTFPRDRWNAGVLLTGLCLVLPVTLRAGEPGSSTANFLRIGVGVRAVAMGEAYTAVADDVFAQTWNPAGLARIPEKQIGFMHAQLVEGLHYEYGAIALPTRRGTFGVSTGYFSPGEIEGFDHTGSSLGTLPRSFDVTSSLSYGGRVGEDLVLGFTGRVLYKRLVTDSASTVAADVGVQYHTPLDGLMLGAVAQHLGGRLSLIQQGFDLPRTLKIGAVYKWDGALIAIDGHHPRDQTMFVTMGGELWLGEWLVLRAGWKSRDDVGSRFRVGMGFTLKKQHTVDYAFLPLGAFGDTHRISFTIRWDPLDDSRFFLARPFL